MYCLGKLYISGNLDNLKQGDESLEDIEQYLKVEYFTVENDTVVNEMTEKELYSFSQLMKNGIYKELHHRKLLNDMQLNLLLTQKT